MRTLHSFATVCVLGAALAALLPACSSDNSSSGGTSGAPGVAGANGSAAGASNTAGSAGSAAGGGSTLTGNATNGASLWTKNACNGCHGEHAEGGGAPNITKSATGGIGAFTLAQFRTAVHDAKNKQGQPLCGLMQPFPNLTDQEIADLYAFQQAQPAVDTPVANPAYCGNMCCTGEHK